MDKEFELFNQIGKKLAKKGVDISQMFGKPCLKINGKAFACFFQKEMVFKLEGKEHEKALTLKGSQLFDPSGKGRPMKEWVQVPATYKNEWATFTTKALRYVEEMRK